MIATTLIPDEMPADQSTAMLNALIIQGLPKDKVEAMKAYAKKLHKNSPGMKPKRVQRLVAEKFHIDLV